MDRNSEDLAFRLSEFLSERAKSTKGARKRYRTKAKILAATALEMERVGYDSMTVDGIVDAADMARGTFYLYFENRADAAKAVLRRYNALRRARRPRGGHSAPRYEAIFRYTQYYVSLYARNAALLVGREALMREAPEEIGRRDRTNERWARVVMRDFCSRVDAPITAMDDPSLVLSFRSAIAMVDELLREIFVYKSPSMKVYTDDIPRIAEVISLAWYRIVYGETPDLALLKSTRNYAELSAGSANVNTSDKATKIRI